MARTRRQARPRLQGYRSAGRIRLSSYSTGCDFLACSVPLPRGRIGASSYCTGWYDDLGTIASSRGRIRLSSYASRWSTIAFAEAASCFMAIGEPNDASPSKVSAKPHHICTFATSLTYAARRSSDSPGPASRRRAGAVTSPQKSRHEPA
jgi:hypothetical protein